MNLSINKTILKLKNFVNSNLYIIIFVTITLVAATVLGILFSNNYLSININPEISSTGKIVKINFESIELANTERERQAGLMNRQDLCDTCGMLFVFEESSYRSFWMENTYLPLDIIFIDDSGKVINISYDATPLDSEKRYKSDKPAKYVLEVNGGFSKKYDLKAGDIFKIQELIDSAKPYQKDLLGV